MKHSTFGICAGLCLLLAGCGAVDRLSPGSYDRPLRSERLTFDGHYFRARTRHASDDRREFTVLIRKAQRSSSGAFQAAQFEATKYCLGLFGASDHVLDANPETPEADLPVDSSGDWLVSGRSDRTGYRLEGQALDVPDSIASEPVLPGSFQVPGNGQPIITMVDGPTVGGYPKIGSALSLDTAALAQLRPGGTVWFSPISIHTAHNALHLAHSRYQRTPMEQL